METIDATFDGTVFRPDTPLSLDKDTRYRLIVEALPAPDVWQVLSDAAGSVSAPADWAAQHDHYLYGTPKTEPQP